MLHSSSVQMVPLNIGPSNIPEKSRDHHRAAGRKRIQSVSNHVGKAVKQNAKQTQGYKIQSSFKHLHVQIKTKPELSLFQR